MKRDQQRLPDYLGHILEAIERIGRYTDDIDENSFLQDEMAQDAVIRNLEIIGEATTLSAITRSSLQPILSFRLLLPTRCVTPWLTAISKLIWKSSGKPSRTIWQACIPRFRLFIKPCRKTEVTTRHQASRWIIFINL